MSFLLFLLLYCLFSRATAQNVSTHATQGAQNTICCHVKAHNVSMHASKAARKTVRRLGSRTVRCLQRRLSARPPGHPSFLMAS